MTQKKDKFMVVMRKEDAELAKKAGIEKELDEALAKFQKGDFSDSNPVNVFNKKLKCNQCSSWDTLLFKSDDDEYDFMCFNCKHGFWFDQEEMDRIVKENPDCIQEIGEYAASLIEGFKKRMGDDHGSA